VKDSHSYQPIVCGTVFVLSIEEHLPSLESLVVLWWPAHTMPPKSNPAMFVETCHVLRSLSAKRCDCPCSLARWYLYHVFAFGRQVEQRNWKTLANMQKGLLVRTPTMRAVSHFALYPVVAYMHFARAEEGCCTPQPCCFQREADQGHSRAQTPR